MIFGKGARIDQGFGEELFLFRAELIGAKDESDGLGRIGEKHGQVIVDGDPGDVVGIVLIQPRLDFTKTATLVGGFGHARGDREHFGRNVGREGFLQLMQRAVDAPGG